MWFAENLGVSNEKRCNLTTEQFNKAFSKIYYKAIEDYKAKAIEDEKNKEKCDDLISLIIEFLFMLFNHDIILYDTSLKYEELLHMNGGRKTKTKKNMKKNMKIKRI